MRSRCSTICSSRPAAPTCASTRSSAASRPTTSGRPSIRTSPSSRTTCRASSGRSRSPTSRSSWHRRPPSSKGWRRMVDVRSFVGEPRVTLMSAGRDARDGSIAYATDLLVDGVSLLPRSGHAASGDLVRRQLWYGALCRRRSRPRSRSAARRCSTRPTRTIDGCQPDGRRRAAEPLRRGCGKHGRRRATFISGGPRERRAGPRPGGRGSPSGLVDGRSAYGSGRSILDPGLGGAVPRGPAAPGLRILDTSYTHGAGGRLPPRPPIIRPPPGGAGGGGGGGALTSPRAAPSVCGPSDSTGYIATISCVSMVAVASWVLLGVGVAGLIIIWYLILTT